MPHNNVNIDHRPSLCKGFPPLATQSAHEAGTQIPRDLLQGEFPLPLLVLKESALAHNLEWMARFCRKSSALLCPHGKTSMAPALLKRQLAAGAWGLTAATVHQVQVYRSLGVQRILLANQLVGQAELMYTCAEIKQHPDFDFYCLVDSPAGVERLARAAARANIGRPLQVLAELGIPGGRSGCRSVHELLELARGIREKQPLLSLRGVEGFEGVAVGSLEDGARRVGSYLQQLADAGTQCAAAGLFGEGVPILSAGGSIWFDLAAAVLTAANLAQPHHTVLRSGCYVTLDHGVYQKMFAHTLQRSSVARALGEGLQPALELWTHVLSLPEPDLAVLGFGKRDCPYDMGLPVPLHWVRTDSDPELRPFQGAVISGLYDQHACLRLPIDHRLQVGDMVACGISHPCGAFDRWRALALVDDDYRMLEMIDTFF